MKPAVCADTLATETQQKFVITVFEERQSHIHETEVIDAMAVYILKAKNESTLTVAESLHQLYIYNLKLEIVKNGLHFVVPKGVKAADGK